MLVVCAELKIIFAIAQGAVPVDGSPLNGLLRLRTSDDKGKLPRNNKL